MGLVLTLNEISVEFVRFLDTNYPRVLAEGSSSKVEFSIFGTPAIDGPAYISRHIWACNAIYTHEQRDLLEALFAEFHYRRRNQQLCDILIYDTTATLKERSPRTRALVPDTSERAIGSSHVAYYAQFKGVFTEGPKFNKAGQWDFVQFTLTETVLVP
jgi:hypothetical protein